MSEPIIPQDVHDATVSAEESSRAKRFRFKRKRDPKDDGYRERHRHRKHHHRNKVRKQSPFHDDPSAFDNSVSRLPPDVAFRESLFDALGDDEGAEYWQGVYGQPIHNYPDTYLNKQTGELEKMNDEEYAAHVRRKMWEKSWEGIEAMKEEKQRQRERDKQREHAHTSSRSNHEVKDDNAFIFDLEIEHSLRRGQRRKDKKKWKLIWEDYLRRWDVLQSLQQTTSEILAGSEQHLRNKIVWPVESGKRKDLKPEEIAHFFTKCSECLQDDKQPDVYANLLKTERVRFHPDKIQQRYGYMQIDEGTMQGVTAVFQVIDRLWNENRQK